VRRHGYYTSVAGGVGSTDGGVGGKRVTNLQALHYT
jgi:hypothetical protein